MKRFLPILTALYLSAAVAGPTPQELIGQMEGVYKHRFANAEYNPNGKDIPYQSEDIIEIVRYDDSHVYIRANLEFYNGHNCSIWGIGGYEDGGFVYHDPEPPLGDDAQCRLKVALKGDKLTVTDRLSPDSESTCRRYCGARGSLSEYSIPHASRRTIRYLDRLKASREYQQAVDALHKTEGTTAR